MSKKRKQLSNAEIWDDSGLVQSWDESYEEYKRYHSIAARGEQIEDVLDEADEPDHGPVDEDPSNDSLPADAVLEEGEVDDVSQEAPAQLPPGISVESSHLDNEQKISESQRPSMNGVADHASAAFPTSLASQTLGVGEGSLKNLMMSWYWAGYYTGYQQAQTELRSQDSIAPPANPTRNGQETLPT